MIQGGGDLPVDIGAGSRSGTLGDNINTETKPARATRLLSTLHIRKKRRVLKIHLSKRMTLL